MKFGEAIELVKQGKLVQRKGWNGKGMFIFQRPEDTLSVEVLVNNVKSLPKAVKDWYGQKSTHVPEDQIKFTAYLCMKAADDSIVNGWLASQTDMLSEDWQEVNP